MDRYIDILILPEPEFPATVTMNVLFAKLHLAFVEIGNRKVGVSFPKFEKTPGSILRLHGKEKRLAALVSMGWQKPFRDNIRVGQVRPVPAVAKHRVVKRVQVKSSPERLRRRLMKRKEISVEEAIKAIPERVAQTTNLPFISMTSTSTGQRFRLFIKHGEEQDEAVEGEFNSYGLSLGGTIPWF